MTPTPEMVIEQISRTKSDAFMSLLISGCTGPREAFALIITTLWRLNFEMDPDRAVSIDQLVVEVSLALRSIESHTHAAN